MTVTSKIQNQISELEPGSTFRYEHLNITPKEFMAAAKAIERMIKHEVIKRISSGIFYKPQKTIFGELNPSEEEILKPYLFEKGERIAYVTGTSLYNQMGLTTQIPEKIKIASRNKRITVSAGNVNARPVKSYVEVTGENYHLLEILDALKDLKQIPDLDKKSVLAVLSERLKALGSNDRRLLLKCTLAYPPRARSLLGALLENLRTSIDLTELKRSLNPLSEYNYGINRNLLPTAKNWNIK